MDSLKMQCLCSGAYPLSHVYQGIRSFTPKLSHQMSRMTTVHETFWIPCKHIGRTAELSLSSL